MTDKEKEIAAAIKNLRTHLGESQQGFSNRLGVAVRTVARWELESPPKGIALLKLTTLAQKVDRFDLSNVLLNAHLMLQANMALLPPNGLEENYDPKYAGCMALINTLLSADYETFWPNFIEFLHREYVRFSKQSPDSITPEELIRALTAHGDGALGNEKSDG